MYVCVMNDSAPWWCELPACEASKAERAAPVLGAPPRQCTGEPLSACPSSCNGRGSCLGGACRCYAGFRGAACEESDKDNSCLQGCSGRGECLKGFCRCTPPWWGADCALGATASEWPRCSRRPCIYVYELPARMNVLALKVEFDWRIQAPGRKYDYRFPLLFHEALLGSGHRTSDASQADLFFVPTYDFQGSWGNPEVYFRAARYVSQAWPYWNASGGARSLSRTSVHLECAPARASPARSQADHLWAVARDAGACATPWGSLADELASSSLLLNWGGERCYEAARDLVVPGALVHSIVAKSPFWGDAAAVATAHRRRSTRLFFIGALCWKISDKTFAGAEGFRLYATDYPPSMPRRRVNVNEEILASQYCLCPSGTGWGMRVYHAAVLGCVPVLVQDDGAHPRVAQAFEPELRWDSFSVIVPRAAVANLSAVLAATDLQAKQRALATTWHRMIWRNALQSPQREKLPSPDAFEATVASLGRLVERRSERLQERV
ncbi:hypothetical protein EMIHUDRAFT_457504 [Emiliania huxleyi CCMP1516]|uniref:Exostosin GT47 domain-containing protein n=2 Tax=Emiliania huxleyi TaxID=2903 RepID=A0A0D3JQ03_EMIH1|nr:hypothetical protein EMIHUDRAFT_457504 [Emiliania huxleyi CCMP1516]EOD25588.1 hypothetical protein EMIHUDRAFT_457504 [Emiliania huxleyi CCMP1516]|eukprot:XP_005778017.1 hypothetical protein EMIHUDRAFT_457504 [Emiliania huxleyi CCMP1516]